MKMHLQSARHTGEGALAHFKVHYIPHLDLEERIFLPICKVEMCVTLSRQLAGQKSDSG
jgi:hypothetical protein